MSITSAGYDLTPEHAKRLKQGLLDRHWKPSEETKRRLSQINKGKTLSPETRAKISVACSGRSHTEQEIEKMREAWNNRKSKSTSFPEMGIGRWKPDDPRRRPVYTRVSVGQIWQYRNGHPFEIVAITGDRVRYWLSRGTSPQYREVRVDFLLRRYKLIRDTKRQDDGVAA